MRRTLRYFPVIFFAIVCIYSCFYSSLLRYQVVESCSLNLGFGCLTFDHEWSTPPGSPAPQRLTWQHTCILHNKNLELPAPRFNLLGLKYGSGQWGTIGLGAFTINLYRTYLAIPLYLPTLLSAMLAFRPRRKRSSPDLLCPTCAYDLRMHHPGDKCPECGTPILILIFVFIFVFLFHRPQSITIPSCSAAPSTSFSSCCF